MKKSLRFVAVIISLFAISLVFVSCNSDDDDDEKSIVGVWNFRDLSIVDLQTNNATNDGKMKADLLAKSKEDYGDTKLVFNYDGTAVINDSFVVPNYRYGNGTLILFYTSQISDTLKVSLNKNVLTLIEDYTEDYQDMGSDQLAQIGISDTADFKVIKAQVGINYSRTK